MYILTVSRSVVNKILCSQLINPVFSLFCYPALHLLCEYFLNYKSSIHIHYRKLENMKFQRKKKAFLRGYTLKRTIVNILVDVSLKQSFFQAGMHTFQILTMKKFTSIREWIMQWVLIYSLNSQITKIFLFNLSLPLFFCKYWLTTLKRKEESWFRKEGCGRQSFACQFHTPSPSFYLGSRKYGFPFSIVLGG